jgi:hypothetical protein
VPVSTSLAMSLSSKSTMCTRTVDGPKRLTDEQ